jgi:hypothetical protein
MIIGIESVYIVEKSTREFWAFTVSLHKPIKVQNGFKCKAEYSSPRGEIRDYESIICNSSYGAIQMCVDAMKLKLHGYAVPEYDELYHANSINDGPDFDFPYKLNLDLS